MNAIDLFAGPGGWDVAARQLGIHPLGIEYDDAACATRKAGGHRTLQGDVAALDPLQVWGAFVNDPVRSYWEDEWAAKFNDPGGAPLIPVPDVSLDLLIASPPCQAWSMAGKRGGEADKGLVYELTDQMVRTEGLATIVPDDAWEDPRSKLVTEPLRWALALRPRFIALEQVPPVIDYWKHIANILRDEGYGVWTGILEAERYGVPQTRERAILMASRGGASPEPPRPTHQRYIPGEAARHDVTLEGEILPWVSMAEALGWNDGRRMAKAMGAGMVEPPASAQARSRRATAPSLAPRSVSWCLAVGHRPVGLSLSRMNDVNWEEPTITDTGNTRGGTRKEGRTRRASEPAPVVTSRADQLERRGDWTAADDRDWVVARRTAEGYEVIGDERPAPTVKPAGWPRGGSPRFDDLVHIRRDVVAGRDFVPAAEVGTVRWATVDEAREDHADAAEAWPQQRPATAVCGDPRVSPPGYRGRADDYDAEGNYKGERSMDNAVRVTIPEASILQGFPPDYPWQGSRTKKFQQIGNGVPPPLSLAVLTALIGEVEAELREAA